MKRSRSISQVTFEIKRMRTRNRKQAQSRSRRRQVPKEFLTLAAMEFLKPRHETRWVFEKQQGRYHPFMKVAFGRSQIVDEHEVLLFDANEKVNVAFKVAENGHVKLNSNRSLYV